MVTENVSTIGYGETYKSDLNKKAMPLSIVLSNCSGVTIAEVEAKRAPAAPAPVII